MCVGAITKTPDTCHTYQGLFLFVDETVKDVNHDRFGVRVMKMVDNEVAVMGHLSFADGIGAIGGEQCA